MKSQILSSMIFVLCAMPAMANTETAKKPELTVEEWMTVFRSVLPNKLCDAKTPFRTCFDVTAQECENEAIRAVRICAETYSDDIKAAFKKAAKEEAREVANTWGKKLGGCSGAAIAVNMLSKLKKEPECIKQFS